MSENNFNASLKNLILEACKKIWNIAPEKISLEPTSKEFYGDYTLVTFELAKTLRASPEQIARAIGEWLVEHADCVSSFEVKGGFLNIVLKDECWLKNFATAKTSHMSSRGAVRKTFVVEFSSPNTNKPLHLGHLRNNFLGQSIVRILQAMGHTVHSVCVVNDRGIHIAKSMVAYKNFGNSETPATCEMKGDKCVGKYYVLFDKILKEQVVALLEKNPALTKDLAEQQAPIMLEAQESLRLWEKGDSATLDLWRRMNGWVYEGFKETYKRIGTTFDKVYYESETYLLGKEVVSDGLARGIFYKKEDGSIWVDLTAEGLDQKLLMRRDGTSVYITQDLGMADLRYREFAFDEAIYVVGNEQDYHFDVLFKTLKHLGREYAERLAHLSYGMVELPSGKMKSREGTVVDADDLIAEVEAIAREHTERLGKIDGFSNEEAETLYKTLAMGALKYQILKVDPQKKILFNPEESIDFQGNTGPFVQYTYARICSILCKAETLGIKFSGDSPELAHKLHPLERDLLKQICDYGKVLSMSAAKLAPSVIAQYVFELSKLYNRFYAELSVLQCDDIAAKNFRLLVSSFVKDLIRECLYTLCIEAPQKM